MNRLLPLASILLANFASATQAHFTDISDVCGVDYLQNQSLTAGMTVMCGGAAAGDCDGDGWVDLFVTTLDRNSRLYRNLGENSQGEHQGFALVNSSSFTPRPPGPRMNGASFADVDGDGDLDLLLTGLGTPRPFLWINDGNGHFTEEGATRGLILPGPVINKAFSASFGDYDVDGYLDLYITEWGTIVNPTAPEPSNSRLLRNLGQVSPGYFEDMTDFAGVGLEDSTPSGPSGTWNGVYSFTPKFADFNNDGLPDLAIAGDFTTSRLYWNIGNGKFTDGTAAAGVGRDENGMGAAVADFDRDGNLDWFITSIYDPLDTCSQFNCNWGSSGNRLYLGDGAGTFSDATDSGVRDGAWGWGATDIDYDNDGWLDIAMTNGFVADGLQQEDMFNHDPSKLFRNNGGGFDDVSVSAGIRDRASGKGIVKLDFDRDGDQDLFIVNTSGKPVFYRNDGGNAANWLQVELAGSGANTFGIGARAVLWPDEGDAPLVREQSASSNYLSQNETLLHFGLGADSLVDRLEVTWPNGAVSVLEDVTSRQRITVHQP